MKLLYVSLSYNEINLRSLGWGWGSRGGAGGEEGVEREGGGKERERGGGGRGRGGEGEEEGEGGGEREGGREKRRSCKHMCIVPAALGHCLSIGMIEQQKF